MSKGQYGDGVIELHLRGTSRCQEVNVSSASSWQTCVTSSLTLASFAGGGCLDETEVTAMYAPSQATRKGLNVMDDHTGPEDFAPSGAWLDGGGVFYSVSYETFFVRPVPA